MNLLIVTIELLRQDHIDMGLDIDGDKSKCCVNKSQIAFFYPSHDDGKGLYGTKIHMVGGEHIWCYDDFDSVKSRLKND
jgi:hypothetical protein